MNSRVRERKNRTILVIVSLSRGKNGEGVEIDV